MVRRRSYARYARGGAVPLAVEIDTPLADHAADVLTETMMPAAEAHDPTPKVVHDDASVAFKGQLNSLRAAEASERERMAQAIPALPATRELRLQHWRDQGFSTDEAAYCNALHEYPQRTAAAVMAASQLGIDANDDAFHREVQKNFHRLTAVEAEAQAAQELEAADATKRISKSNTTLARGGAVDDDDLRRGRICSAPVSRSVPDGGSYNERNGRVTLTPAQVDAARISGVSLTTYAEQLLRLREEKLNGNYTGRP